jgi:hypothetical protein
MVDIPDTATAVHRLDGIADLAAPEALTWDYWTDT